MKRLLLAGAMALGLIYGASAWAADAFDTLFAPLTSGGCVAMSDVRSAGSVVELTPDQFQFVRAFYMAIPPLSHALPPGDKAFYTIDGDGVEAFGLVDSAAGKVCVVFQSSKWLKRLIDQVGRGEVGKVGDPT